MRRMLMQSLRLMLVFTLLTGLAYPLLVTGFAELFFPGASGGSLLMSGGHPVGSRLLAQSFTSARYFHGRPSASECGTLPSGAGNLGPTSRPLRSSVLARITEVREREGLAAGERVPSDLVFQSGSGLDPDISRAAALCQVRRVARARALDERRIAQQVEAATRGPQCGILGEERVNVLLLNAALDRL